MVWSDLRFDFQEISPAQQPTRKDDVNFDTRLHAYYREALGLRKRFPALCDGEMQVIGAENSAGMFAFTRSGSEVLLAVFNRNPETQTFTFRYSSTDGSEPTPLVPFFISSGALQEAQVKQGEGKVSIILPGYTGALFSPK